MRAKLTLLLVAVMLGLAPHLAGAAGQPAAEEPAETVFRGVSYVGLTVSDLQASAEVYAESANLEEVARGKLEGSDALDTLAGRAGVVADSRLLQSSNAQVRLMQFEPSKSGTDTLSSLEAVPVNGPGFAHVCYQSDGILETYQKFLASGAKPIGNPEMVTLNPRNQVVYAYALDADGIMFEVEHIDVDAIPGNKPPKGFYRIRHVSLATPDIERTISFYSTLLGNQKPRQIGGPEGFSGEQFDQVSGLPGTRLRMAWFQVRNLELEIVQYVSHPTAAPAEPRSLFAPGYNMVVFDVANLEAARERLLQAGGTVVTEPSSMDGGKIFFGRDLDENLLGFLMVPEDSKVFSARFPTQ